MNEKRRELVRSLLQFVPALGTFAFFLMKFIKFGGEVVGAILLVVVIGVFYGNIVHLWQQNDELLFQMDELRKNIEKAVNDQAGQKGMKPQLAQDYGKFRKLPLSGPTPKIKTAPKFSAQKRVKILR